MPSTQKCTVEFFGGPFDGHKRDLSFPPDELNDLVVLPVNQNVVHMLNGDRCYPKAPATSVAVYELQATFTPPRYTHLGAAKPDQFRMASWIG